MADRPAGLTNGIVRLFLAMYRPGSKSNFHEIPPAASGPAGWLRRRLAARKRLDLENRKVVARHVDDDGSENSIQIDFSWTIVVDILVAREPQNCCSVIGAWW